MLNLLYLSTIVKVVYVMLSILQSFINYLPYLTERDCLHILISTYVSHFVIISLNRTVGTQ